MCVPGTGMCASADGRGGVQINATGSGQVTPGGASASAQAHGSGQAKASAQGSGNAQGNGNAQGSGNAQGNGNAQGSGSAQGSGNAQGNGSVQGNGTAQGDGHGHVNDDRSEEVPRRRRPSSSGSDTGHSGHGQGYIGRFAVGVSGCPLVRVGVWSGVKAGGCVGVSFRFEGFMFEMETQLLYGGSTRAFDWTFPLSFLIPLSSQSSLFEGPYLRFGGSPVGATFASAENGGSFVRFGLFAGAGYETVIAHTISWRVIDARASFDLGTRRAMDRSGHLADLGIQLGTGVVF
jgi:hypothetical protein